MKNASAPFALTNRCFIHIVNKNTHFFGVFENAGERCCDPHSNSELSFCLTLWDCRPALAFEEPVPAAMCATSDVCARYLDKAATPRVPESPSTVGKLPNFAASPLAPVANSAINPATFRVPVIAVCSQWRCNRNFYARSDQNIDIRDESPNSLGPYTESEKKMKRRSGSFALFDAALARESQRESLARWSK